jgi:gluconolactonase
MKCDAQGNVWVSGPGGVWVYSPRGDLLGKLRVPELVGNLAWGGSDWRTLFLTATHSVYAIDTKVGPKNEPFMRAGAGGQRRAPGGVSGQPVSDVRPAAAVSAEGVKKAAPGYRLDPSRCALLVRTCRTTL